MDTTVLKSWCEVVRRTDPLIWALTVESQATDKNNVDTLFLSSSLPSPSTRSLFTSASSTAVSTGLAGGGEGGGGGRGVAEGTGSDATAMDKAATAAARRKMFSSFRDSRCKSISDPHLSVSQPQNAIDWLKCLIQTSATMTHDDLCLKQDSYHHLPRTRRGMDTSFEKASSRHLLTTENIYKEEEAVISRKTTGAGGEHIGEAPAGSASTSNTASTSGSGSGSGSGSTSSSPMSTESSTPNTTSTHPRKAINNNSTYYATTFNWMYYATEPAPAIAPSSASSTHFGSRNDDHAGPTSSSSSSGNAVGGAIISPSIATFATAAVSSHIAIEREALRAASAASAATAAAALPSGDLQGSESTNNNSDATLANSNANINSLDSTISNTNTATTATTTSAAIDSNNNNNNKSLSIPSRFKLPFPDPPTITLASTTAFLYSSFHSTKDATSAFFYRTFSPTYRICTLYKSSFTDGTQARALRRLKDSIIRVDAVVLVKSSAKQMKDIWEMVKVAYGEKAKVAKNEKRQSERAKVVKEGREKVEEGIRSMNKAIEETARTTAATAATSAAVEKAVEVEAESRKAGDDESQAEDGNSSVVGVSDVGGGGLD